MPALGHTDQNGIDNPSFMAFDVASHSAYAVNENYGSNAQVLALSIRPTDGSLTIRNAQDTGAQGTVHVAVDHTGQHVLVANFASANIESFSVLADGGGLGVSSAPVSTGAQPHDVAFMPDDTAIFVPCHGSDEVWQFA
jgi:6-phosphogluconolactonase (cycloisomerase 2 family)